MGCAILKDSVFRIHLAHVLCCHDAQVLAHVLCVRDAQCCTVAAKMGLSLRGM